MRETAVKGLGNVCKRFPCLALPAMPTLLAALARLPLPDRAALDAAFGCASAAEGIQRHPCAQPPCLMLDKQHVGPLSW